METTVEVVEQSQVAEVRRLVAELGKAQGLTDVDLGRAALLATEASTNLVKYAQGGTVTVSRYSAGGVEGLQLLAVDRGPGIRDFSVVLRDGHSTGGSLGLGLGAIVRTADVFDVYTAPGMGSAFLMRVLRKRALPAIDTMTLDVGARSAPIRGERECGDAWCCSRAGKWQRLCVVDGLGHGPLAASAAADAVAVFRAARESDTASDILDRCHLALRSTRGAAMAVAAIDTAEGVLEFAGVGNIAAVVHSGDATHHLLSAAGIVGYQMRPAKAVRRPWNAGASLIMSSDGLSTRWSISRYPDLLQRRADLVAAVLFRHHARTTDDATVLVAKDSR